MSRSAGSRGPEVVVAEALPDLLLGPAGDAERRQLPGAGRVEEVRRHRQLEDSLLEGRRIPLAEPALPEHAPRLLERGIEVAPGEDAARTGPAPPARSARATPAPAARPGRGARARRAAPAARPTSSPPASSRSSPQCTRSASRSATCSVQPTGTSRGDRRAPAAALVVVDQLPAVGQRVEAGQQVVVMRARAAVQHHGGRPLADAAGEELDAADRHHGFACARGSQA